MVTMLEIVQDAFEEISVKTAEIPLTSDELQSGIRRCNDMLTEWDDIGIIYGYTPVLNGDDIVSIDRNAVAAVKYNLAIRLCPSFQKVASSELIAVAQSTLDRLMATSTDLSIINYPDSLPMGSGNDCHSYEDNRFFPANKKENF